jgi:hypothetical protein
VFYKALQASQGAHRSEEKVFSSEEVFSRAKTCIINGKSVKIHGSFLKQNGNDYELHI